MIQQADKRTSMIERLIRSAMLALPLLVVLGCGSAEVEVPDNPTPPPGSDPVTTPGPSQNADG